jgi:hypothetical protein
MFTKEKVVFAVTLVVSLVGMKEIRKPSVEEAPKVAAEEAPRPPRVTVPVPPLHPDKPLDANARDPFVPLSAWVPATPALLALPPEPKLPRTLPGGSPPGVRARLVVIPEDPKAVDEGGK